VRASSSPTPSTSSSSTHDSSTFSDDDELRSALARHLTQNIVPILVQEFVKKSHSESSHSLSAHPLSVQQPSSSTPTASWLAQFGSLDLLDIEVETTSQSAHPVPSKSGKVPKSADKVTGPVAKTESQLRPQPQQAKHESPSSSTLDQLRSLKCAPFPALFVDDVQIAKRGEKQIPRVGSSGKQFLFFIHSGVLAQLGQFDARYVRIELRDDSSSASTSAASAQQPERKHPVLVLESPPENDKLEEIDLRELIAIGLGLTIIAQWPLSSLWLMGTVVGIELIARGITVTAASLALRDRFAPAGRPRELAPA
jgi:hypothetical protein